MKWVTNRGTRSDGSIKDIAMTDGKLEFKTISYDELRSRNQIIGEPMVTKLFSVDQLIELGTVGIYQLEEGDPEYSKHYASSWVDCSP